MYMCIYEIYAHINICVYSYSQQIEKIHYVQEHVNIYKN